VKELAALAYGLARAPHCTPCAGVIAIWCVLENGARGQPECLWTSLSLCPEPGKLNPTFHLCLASADATLNQKLEPEITAPNTCGKP